MFSDATISQIIRKLTVRVALDDDDLAAIAKLPYTRRSLEPGSYMIREGDTRLNCSFILTGLAFRQKLSADGARQILSVHMPGDFVDLQHLFLNVADHNVQALTRLEVVDLARNAIQDVILHRPAIGRAMWVDGLVDASISREWLLNIGRRDARRRVAHLLCEFSVRMRQAGIAEQGGYELPMTQEQLGDAVGLTSVHVNRTLKLLVADQLVRFDRRRVQILDWERLRDAGDFATLYLHLDQTWPEGSEPSATV